MVEQVTRPWQAIEQEITGLLARVDPGQFQALLQVLQAREGRWFFSGQGRSGLIAQMAAMRLMHAGIHVHVVGEASAPAVRQGDRFVLVCGSGRTPVSLSFARIAREAGATLIVVTHKPASELAAMSDLLLTVPMEQTAQFGGTLFEQVTLILFDALCHALSSGRDAHAAMWTRHTNMQ